MPRASVAAQSAPAWVRFDLNEPPGGSVIPGMRLSRLLLTNASLVTLSVASIGRAVAGTTVSGQAGVYNVPADADWINVDTSNLSTFFNSKDITDGFNNPDDPGQNALALHVRATNPLISTLING